ncbi:MAG: archease [Chloroflexi bacterium]|nr:archease [Chloroflexota bacterium]
MNSYYRREAAIGQENLVYTGDMDSREAGFRELEHTADWELYVWAPDLPALLEQAARGMYQLSHTRLADAPRLVREFELPFTDRESLLVDFLSELLFYGEEENLAFDEYQLDLDESSLRVRIVGAPIEDPAKEIKAVTYHRLAVRETGRGLEVQIVFDV